MHPLAAILSLLIAAAGWFYMFYSRAAEKLADIEAQAINLRRIRMRRAGGLAMFLLAIFFFAGFRPVNNEESARWYLFIWMMVILLLGLIVILGLIDLRLTMKLRRHRRQDPPQ